MKKLGTPKDRMFARISFLMVRRESGDPGTLLEIVLTSFINSSARRSSSFVAVGWAPVEARAVSEFIASVDTHAKRCAHELKLFQFTLRLVWSRSFLR